jgi:hypothetical protein
MEKRPSSDANIFQLVKKHLTLYETKLLGTEFKRNALLDPILS